MSLVKDLGIVLRRLDYSETSQVLVIFTRDNGQQRLIAKGVKRATKKKASAGIDLLELGRVVFSQRPGKEDALATLTEWRQEESFPHLQRDLLSLYAAQYAAEVTAQLTEVNDAHAVLFDALCAALRAMTRTDPLAALVRFLWIMLREIGLRPDLANCANCNRPVGGDHVLYFSSRSGGAICRDCETHTVEKTRIDGLAAMMLSAMNDMTGSSDWQITSEVESAVPQTIAPADRKPIRAAFDLLDYHLTETMGKQARLRGPLLNAISR